MIFFYYVLLLFRLCGAENYDFDDIIDRPCPRLNPSCIRIFFAQHSTCVPTYGTLLDVYPVDELQLPLPLANLYFIWKDGFVKGLNNGSIKEFYINQATKNLVLLIEFRDVLAYSSTATINYYFKGKEPLQLSDHFNIKYTKFTQTVTAPFDSIFGIRWEEKDVHTYFDDPRLPCVLGKGLTNSDPEVDKSYKKMLRNVPLSVKQVFPALETNYFDLYFDNNICSFEDWY